MKRKRMTVYEFKEYLSECKPLWILYDSELQDHYDPASPMNFKLLFSKVAVEECPDTIHLFNQEQSAMILPHPDYILLENRSYHGSPIVRIIHHKYTGAESQDTVLILSGV